jgi:hypothetical protein
MDRGLPPSIAFDAVWHVIGLGSGPTTIVIPLCESYVLPQCMVFNKFKLYAEKAFGELRKVALPH